MNILLRTNKRIHSTAVQQARLKLLAATPCAEGNLSTLEAGNSLFSSAVRWFFTFRRHAVTLKGRRQY